MTTDTNYDRDRTVTAFFDTRAAAEKAKSDVVAAGIPADMVTIVEGRSQDSQGATKQAHEGGFWNSVKNLFAPDEDKHAYAEGLSRGGFLLTTHTSETQYEDVIDILDKEGAVDMSEREAQWKSEGWSGYHGTASTAETSTASPLRSDALSKDRARGSAQTLSGAREAPMSSGTSVDRGGDVGDETIQLAEESLRVGKRDVNHGRVRLRSYVVEKPVNDTVNLHSEQVNVNRRPVGPTVQAAENLFQERTISAEGHHEEAVVSKDARVYEEVGLDKTVEDRAHEINETVRRTEVEVDDGRNAAASGSADGERTGAVGRRDAVGDRQVAFDEDRSINDGNRASMPERTDGTADNREIAEHMEVIASDGTRVGTVDHLDTDDRIKLTKAGAADDRHHFIPRSWVDHVDSHVHLNKTGEDVRTGWQAA